VGIVQQQERRGLTSGLSHAKNDSDGELMFMPGIITGLRMP
jgi:hypothetical protein